MKPNHRLVVRGIKPLICDLCPKPQEFVVSFYHATRLGPEVHSQYTSAKFNGPLIAGRACVGHVAEVTAIVLQKAGLMGDTGTPVQGDTESLAENVTVTDPQQEGQS